MKKSGHAATLASEKKKLEDIQAFLGRFAEMKNDLANKASSVPEHVRKLIRRLTEELGSLKKAEREWEMIVAPHFNVFRILHIERKEEKLHSRFIAELLNPRGLHGQRDRFLKLFLDVAREADQSHPLRAPGSTSEEWQVTTEECVIQSDRLDIVLRCTNPKYIMVIENKVDAREQQEQLSRYSKWLEEQARLFPVKDMVFLTPSGRLPSELKSRVEWTCLSYNNHIADWLSRALRNLEADSLRLAIEQYLKIVETL